MSDDKDKRNRMIYEYLYYLHKNNICKHERTIPEEKKVNTNNLDKKGKCPKSKGNIKELNIYDGCLELDIEYYDEYSKYICDINSRSSMNLNKFIKLLEDNNIRHPDKDKNKYLELQKLYELPNINNIKSKYYKYGWILCNKENNYYASLEECEKKIKEYNNILIKKHGDNYEYMDELEIYNEYLKMDNKIPDIYYLDFYIPTSFDNTDVDINLDLNNTDVDINLDLNNTDVNNTYVDINLDLNNTDVNNTDINLDLNNYNNFTYKNCVVLNCKLENRNLELDLENIFNNIYKLLNDRNVDINHYRNRIINISNNDSEYLQIILEFCDLYNISFYIELELQDKKKLVFKNNI
jgi:hypothetical protein